MSCGNCQRLVDFIDRPAHPPVGTDPQKLHPIFLKSPPAYSVLCSCGHYTFYVAEADRAVYEAKYLKGQLTATPSAASHDAASDDAASDVPAARNQEGPAQG
jgi:hypothetical protein